MTESKGPARLNSVLSRRYQCLHLDIADEEIRAFAQCLKRAGFSHYRQLAIDDNEAYCMQIAAEHLRAALAKAGFAPR
jgi:hypothetical protein